MFSKPRINDPIEPPREDRPAAPPPPPAQPSPGAFQAPPPARPKVTPSQISADITITGNITTTGDIQIDGIVEGDIRAHMLTVGENATITGEIMADDVVVHGLIRGRVRGVKIRLTSTARVEGDIIHKTIAIESGAQFEGSVKRRDDPLGDGKPGPTPVNAPRPQSPAPVKPAEPASAKEPDDRPEPLRSAG